MTSRTSRSSKSPLRHINSSKKEKAQTKFREAYHQGTPYLSRTIECGSSNETRFICRTCKLNGFQPFDGYFENIKVHLKTQNHKKTIRAGSAEENELKASIDFLDGRVSDSSNVSVPEIQNVISSNNTAHNAQRSTDPIHLKFEIVSYLIAHNLPFSFAESLLDFVQSVQSKYETETVNRTRIYDENVIFIARDCIASDIKEKIRAQMRTSSFSIAVDGGHDKFGKSFLAVSVRYFPQTNSIQPQTKLYGLIEMGESSTGEVLYNKVNELLFSGNDGQLLKKNFIGNCTDGAPNMISEKDKGLSNRLKRDNPHIVITHDYCHCYNLIIQEGLAQFPAKIIAIITSMSSHFRRSSQRKTHFRRIQLNLGIDNPLEFIRFVDSRWLSLRDCVDRILNLLNPQQIYFNRHGNKNQKGYLSKINIFYFKILSCLLNKIGFYIKHFEQNDLTNYSISKILRESVVLVSDLILDLPDIDVSPTSQIRRFEEIAAFQVKDEEDLTDMPFRTLESFALKFFAEYPHLEPEFSEFHQDNQKALMQATYDFLASSLYKMKKTFASK